MSILIVCQATTHLQRTRDTARVECLIQESLVPWAAARQPSSHLETYMRA